MFKFLSLFCLWGALGIAAGNTTSNTISVSITVSAKVQAYCQLSTSTLMDFGTINPALAESIADATFSLSCTRGTAIHSIIPAMTIPLHNGTDTIELKQFNWMITPDNKMSDTFTVAGESLSNMSALHFSDYNARILTLRGKIPATALTEVSIGTYTGVLTLTVTYQ